MISKRLSQLPEALTLIDDDVFALDNAQTTTRKITFANLKSAIANYIWNWLTTNKTTDSLAISSVGQKIADAKGLYDLNGLIGNINGNAASWVSGTTTAGSYRMDNGNLWYCKANTTTAPSEDTYWTKVNNSTLNNGLMNCSNSINDNKWIVHTYTFENVTIPANGRIDKSVATTYKGKPLIFALGYCWTGGAVVSNYTNNTIVFYNNLNYDIHPTAIGAIAVYGNTNDN